MAHVSNSSFTSIPGASAISAPSYITFPELVPEVDRENITGTELRGRCDAEAFGCRRLKGNVVSFIESRHCQSCHLQGFAICNTSCTRSRLPTRQCARTLPARAMRLRPAIAETSRETIPSAAPIDHGLLDRLALLDQCRPRAHLHPDVGRPGLQGHQHALENQPLRCLLRSTSLPAQSSATRPSRPNRRVPLLWRRQPSDLGHMPSSSPRRIRPTLWACENRSSVPCMPSTRTGRRATRPRRW